MNYKACLILALVTLAGCSAMHSTADRTAKHTAPASNASSSNAAVASAPRASAEKAPGIPDSPAASGSAAEPKQAMFEDQSDMGSAGMESGSTDSDTSQANGADVAPETDATVEDKPVVKPSVTPSQKAQQLKMPATTANSPSEPEPVSKPTPARTKAVAKPKPAQTKAAAKPRAKPQPKPAQLAITGSLQLAVSGGQQKSSADYTNTVIYFVPDKGHARPRPGQFTVYTSHRDFSPAWLVVPLGSKVTFTNLDSVQHNVFSVSPGSQFDLGYQSANQSITHSFDRAGLVLLSCHVHRAMRGDILVVPSRYATAARSNGRFSLSDVPNVAGTLYFWNPRSQRSSSMKVQPPFASIQQKIVLSRPSVATKIGIGK